MCVTFIGHTERASHHAMFIIVASQTPRHTHTHTQHKYVYAPFLHRTSHVLLNGLLVTYINSRAKKISHYRNVGILIITKSLPQQSYKYCSNPC